VNSTIFDLSSDLFRKLIEATPIKNPNVCDAANKYPAEELSSSGKTSSDPYIIIIEGKGIRKKPTKPPRIMMYTVFVI
jgi:hypothetical protein